MKLKFAVVPALLTILLSACGGQSDTPLRVGLLVWPAYEFPYLARDLGYYDDYNIELVEVHTPAEALRAYRSGGLDAVAVTIDYLLQLGARDPAHRAVLVINHSRGADVVLARPGIDEIRDLRGRRVGVERSALGAYMLHRMLDRAGMSRDELKVVSVDIPDTPRAFRAGEVDAVVTYEPYRTRILESGAVELFSSADIPDEIVDVLVTNQAVIESRSRQLRGLIDGWLRAVDYFRAQRAAAAEVLASRERLKPAQYLQALEHIELADRQTNRRMLGGDTPALQEALTRTAAVMRELSLLDGEVAVNELIEGRFVRPPKD